MTIIADCVDRLRKDGQYNIWDTIRIKDLPFPSFVDSVDVTGNRLNDCKIVMGLISRWMLTRERQ